MNKIFFKTFLIISLILIVIFSFNINNVVYSSPINADDRDLEETPPPPSQPSTPSQPSQPSTPSTPPPPPTYSISGSVWEDTDISSGKGIFNTGDILIDGIKVTLYSSNSQELNTTTTSNGNYQFSNLDSGNYKIGFTYGDSTYNGLNYKSAFSPNDVDAGTNAVDSQDKRLELMQKFCNIDYETLSDTESFDTSMIAFSDVQIEDSNVTCNFPMIKRPEYSVKLTKNVARLTIILSDGQTLIDWEPNKTVKHLMVLPDSLTAIMDDEITHGATIKVKYNITVENNSQSDYLYNYFTPDFIKNSNFNSLFSLWYSLLNVKTIFDNVPTTYYLYDYMNNNLIFDESNNPDNWEFLNNSNTFPHSPDMDLSEQTVLVNSVTLKPGETKTLTLNASKIMTIADTDLLTYDNYVEVIAYKSILGKILTYDDELNKRKILTPGNLNIYDDNREYEPDEAKAETVTRVPPFGKDLSYYTTIVGIVILAIEIVILSTLKYRIRKLRKRFIMK